MNMRFCSPPGRNQKMSDPIVYSLPTGWNKTDKLVCKFNTSMPRQNGRCFADDIFKRIFFNENVCISIKISLNCFPKVPINNIAALVQIMAWRRLGDKPLSEPMLINLPTHTCVTRPQWVNRMENNFSLSIVPVDRYHQLSISVRLNLFSALKELWSWLGYFVFLLPIDTILVLPNKMLYTRNRKLTEI